MSRKLTAETRLQALSLPEITHTFERSVLELAPIKFQGRKLRPGTILNALVLEFAAMDAPQRQAIVAAGLAKLAAVIGRDDTGSETAEGPGEPAPKPPAVPTRTTTKLDDKSRARKRKPRS